MSRVVRTREDYDALLTQIVVCTKTGKIWWKPDAKSRKVRGKQAGAVKGNGYVGINYEGKGYFAHRVVYYVAHGELPPSLDHIDRDQTNNAISNLRPATQSQNNFNRGLMPKNTSGVPGVTFIHQIQKWRASIKVNGKRTHLGHFKCVDEAIDARKKAEAEMLKEIFHDAA